MNGLAAWCVWITFLFFDVIAQGSFLVVVRTKVPDDDQTCPVSLYLVIENWHIGVGAKTD